MGTPVDTDKLSSACCFTPVPTFPNNNKKNNKNKIKTIMALIIIITIIIIM